MSSPKAPTSIPELIRRNKAKLIDDFSTDTQILFGFLTLLVDIKYRDAYRKSFEEQHGRGYSK